MATKLSLLAALGGGLTALLAASVAHTQTAQRSLSDEERRHIEQHLDELKAARDDLVRTIQDFNSSIDELETEIRGAPRDSAQTSR